MVSTFSDVPGHEASIGTLKSELQRLAQLIHGTPAGIWRIDLHIGRDKTDEPWAANLGYAVAELGAWGVGEEQKLLDSQDVDVCRLYNTCVCAAKRRFTSVTPACVT